MSSIHGLGKRSRVALIADTSFIRRCEVARATASFSVVYFGTPAHGHRSQERCAIVKRKPFRKRSAETTPIYPSHPKLSPNVPSIADTISFYFHVALTQAAIQL
jgi:hypothetical protein